MVSLNPNYDKNALTIHMSLITCSFKNILNVISLRTQYITKTQIPTKKMKQKLYLVYSKNVLAYTVGF